MINLRKLIAQSPDAGPDELFDEYCRRNGYESSWDEAASEVWMAWLNQYEACKQ